MTTREALLRAILANPAEDTPRLVMADWFTENGQEERGEFIRVQCELSQFDIYEWPERSGTLVLTQDFGLRYDELRRRERELLEILGHTLIGVKWPSVVNTSPLIVVPVGWDNIGHTFRRGFLAELECPWASWLVIANAILREQPVERVKLTTRPPGIEQIIDRLRTDENHFACATWPGIAFELPPAERFGVGGRRLSTVFFDELAGVPDADADRIVAENL